MAQQFPPNTSITQAPVAVSSFATQFLVLCCIFIGLALLQFFVIIKLQRTPQTQEPTGHFVTGTQEYDLPKRIRKG
jgi:hypothetical protein